MPNKIIVKKEDYDDLFDFCSTNEDKMCREAGKKSRANIKVQHTTGRTGCARIVHRMVINLYTSLSSLYVFS